ncbi:hypothetical protein JXB41_05180 [Candidatus Woesearchaeota archaeon]|nr:hypothetical protein [Candidatus Woesearchaeota archaeon]
MKFSKKLIILIILVSILSSPVLAQSVLERASRTLYDFTRNNYIRFTVSFLFYFMMLYGLFGVGLSNLPAFAEKKKLNKYGKLVCLGLAGLSVLGIFALGGHESISSIVARTLGPFAVFSAISIAVAAFSLVYFSFREVDKENKAWRYGLLFMGLSLVWFGYLVTEPHVTSIGWFVAFIGLLVFMIAEILSMGEPSEEEAIPEEKEGKSPEEKAPKAPAKPSKRKPEDVGDANVFAFAIDSADKKAIESAEISVMLPSGESLKGIPVPGEVLTQLPENQREAYALAARFFEKIPTGNLKFTAKALGFKQNSVTKQITTGWGQVDIELEKGTGSSESSSERGVPRIDEVEYTSSGPDRDRFMLNSIEDDEKRRVTVRGTNFTGATKVKLKSQENEIEFDRIENNSEAGKFIIHPEYPDSIIQFIVPINSSAGDYEVLVTNGAGKTNSSSLGKIVRIRAKPIVEHIEPQNSSHVGEECEREIIGRNFRDVEMVFLASQTMMPIRLQEFQVENEEKITVKIPSIQQEGTCYVLIKTKYVDNLDQMDENNEYTIKPKLSVKISKINNINVVQATVTIDDGTNARIFCETQGGSNTITEYKWKIQKLLQNNQPQTLPEHETRSNELTHTFAIGTYKISVHVKDNENNEADSEEVKLVVGQTGTGERGEDAGTEQPAPLVPQLDIVTFYTQGNEDGRIIIPDPSSFNQPLYTHTQPYPFKSVEQRTSEVCVDEAIFGEEAPTRFKFGLIVANSGGVIQVSHEVESPYKSGLYSGDETGPDFRDPILTYEKFNILTRSMPGWGLSVKVAKSRGPLRLDEFPQRDNFRYGEIDKNGINVNLKEKPFKILLFAVMLKIPNDESLIDDWYWILVNPHQKDNPSNCAMPSTMHIDEVKKRCYRIKIKPAASII